MRIILCLLCLLLAIPTPAPGASAPGQADVPADGGGAAQCPVLVYSTNPSYPPYDWVDANGRFDGASIELLKLVIPPGVALKPLLVPWKRALVLAEQGEIDLLVSLRITPERSRYLRFTSSQAFPNPIVVFARKDRPFAFNSWQDLKGRRGGISSGDTFGNGFDEYWRAELTIEEAKNMECNFEKLEAGRIDYFVTSKYVGEAYAASRPLKHGIVVLGKPISTQGIHFGFSRHSPCAALVEQVSRRLQELDRKGLPEQLLQKYLRRFKQRPVPQP